MTAQLIEPDQAPIDSTGWQDMRQQLFGRQHQRDAEQRLIRVLGEVHARLSSATRGAPSAPAAAKARANTLGAVVAGANQLIGWHRDELLAEQTAGRWTGALPELAQEILGDVQAASPLFECAKVTGQAIDCGDIAQSVASLRGAEGDAFFNEALAGAAAMLMAAFAYISTDPPTAPAAAALFETWESLLSDVATLTIATPEPAPEPAPQPAPQPAPELTPQAPQAPALDLTLEPVPGLGLQPAPAPAPTPEPVRSPVPAPRAEHNTNITPIPAARFSRIRLVAC